MAKNAGSSVKMLKEHYDHVSVEYHAERFEMMTEFNRMDDSKELAKALLDEMERRKKLEEPQHNRTTSNYGIIRSNLGEIRKRNKQLYLQLLTHETEQGLSS